MARERRKKDEEGEGDKALYIDQGFRWRAAACLCSI